MRIRCTSPRSAISLVPMVLWPAVTIANSIDVPLHLDPIRQEPFGWTLEEAAVTDVGGSLYLVYNGADYGCAPVGISLFADGSASAPTPVMFTDFNWQCANSVTVGELNDEALVAWSRWTGTEDHVFAALQAPETWTHLSRPRIDLGVGRVPAVVGAGEIGLLAYASTSGLVTVRFDPSIWPSYSSPIPLFQGGMSSFSQTDAAFAAEIDRVMFVWRFGGLMYARITDTHGNPVTNTLTLPGIPTEAPPSVSWNSNHFVVTWSEGHPGSIVLVRIDGTGTLMDQIPILVASSPGHWPASGSINGETLVAWVGEDAWPLYRVRAARISPAGTVLDPGGFLLYQGDRPGYTVALNQVVDVTANGSGYHVTWIENYPSCGGIIFDLQDLRGAVVSSGPPPAVGPSRILSGSGQQTGITAARVGDHFWTTWQGRTRSDHQMFGARRDATGLLLDSQGLVIGQESTCMGNGILQSFFSPVAAGNAGAVLTAWRNVDQYEPWWNNCKVRYCVYNSAGALAGSNEFTFENVGNLERSVPVAAARDSDFLLAFTAPAPNDSIVLSWSGIANNGSQIAAGNFDLGASEVIEDAASDGDGFLVSWSKNADGRDSFVGRLDESFDFLDPGGILLAGGFGDQLPARLASNGTQYLAIWMAPGSLRAARIDPATGSILDQGGVSVVPLAGTAVFDVDWDGEHYILAWAEHVGTQVARLKRIAPDLSSPDPAPVELAERPDGLRSCRVASHDGVSLIAFTRRQVPDGLTTGHGIIYQNPSVAAVAPSASAPHLRLGAIPNPFWSRTEIMTGTLAGQPGTLRIIDVSGRLVHEVRSLQALGHTFPWDGRDATGRPISAGTYFYEISTPGQPAVRGKLIKLP